MRSVPGYASLLSGIFFIGGDSVKLHELRFLLTLERTGYDVA